NENGGANFVGAIAQSLQHRNRFHFVFRFSEHVIVNRDERVGSENNMLWPDSRGAHAFANSIARGQFARRYIEIASFGDSWREYFEVESCIEEQLAPSRRI